MRVHVVALVFFLAVVGCKRKPDEEWSPTDRKETTAPAVRAGTLPPAQPAASDTKPSSDAIVGTVTAVVAKPVILRDTAPIDAVPGTQVKAGDKLQTGENTKLRVTLSDGSILALGPRSSLTIAQYEAAGDNRHGALRVGIGAFWMQVAKWASPEKSFVEIETPNAVAGIRGTTLWGDTQRGVICSLEGTVAVRSVSGKVLPTTLEGGNCAGDLDAGKLTPIVPKAEQVQQYLDEVMIK